MKEILVQILEETLGIFIIAAAITMYLVFGKSNPLYGFNSSLALLGGIAGLLFAMLASGVVSILLTIRDKQEVQIRLLDQMERSLTAGVKSAQEGSQTSEVSVRTSAKPAPRPLSSPTPSQSTLRRCRRCNTILNGVSECQNCEAPISLAN